MKKNVLFIHGGSADGFEVDADLVTSLQTQLGREYKVHYPRILSNEALPDFGWVQQIKNQIAGINGDVIMTAHSLGASMLLKCLAENEFEKKVGGIFLISTPFWSGDESWVQGLKLREDLANKLPKDIPVFLYHCRNDQEVPFEHLMQYSQKLPRAIAREIESGGHQLNNDLSVVAKDIKSL